MKRSTLALVGALLSVYGWTLYQAAPAWPDDWDGIGFLLSVRRFDLATFQPHPPGYPVYVALLRVAAAVAGDAIHAAALVAAGSAVVTVLFAWRALAAVAGKNSWVSAVVLAVTPMVVHASSGVGSEAPALAFFAVAAWGVVTPRHARFAGWAVGAAVACGLGTRVSWLPLYLPLLAFVPPGRRRAALAGLVAGCAAWLVPLVICTGGWSTLLRLLRTHGEGHFTRWGGGAITDPGPRRALDFGRDLVIDGLGAGSDALGIALGFGMGVLAMVGLLDWREAGFPQAKRAAILVVPYAAWVLLGQNVHEQPRHLLPLVALAAVVLGEIVRRVPRVRALGVGLVLLFAARASIDADQRATIAPPMVQLLSTIEGKPGAETAIVAAGPSARFGDFVAHHARVVQGATWGDVHLAVGRLDNLPRRVVVTSEIHGTRGEPAPKRVAVGSYCRPARLDRRGPCLTAFEIAPE